MKARKYVLFWLSMLAISNSYANDIVTNGTFNGTTGWVLADFSQSSYSASNDGTGSVGTGAVYTPGTVPYSGAYISQTLNAVVGQTYNLTFNVAENAGPTSGLSVYWNGQDVLDVLNPANKSYPQWVTESVTGLYAATSAITLEIAAYQNPAQLFLDNISVVSTVATVPEPEIISMFAIGLLGLGLARRKAN